MRGLYIMVLLVLVLPTAQPGPSSPGTEWGSLDLRAEVSREWDVRITELCPGRPLEYCIITNHGPSVRLQGTALDDGEGNVTILADLTLERGASLALVADHEAFTLLWPDMAYLEKGDASLMWSSRFVLADSGDEVLLISPDHQIADAVAYGASVYGGPGWSGPAVGSVPKGHALLREGEDSNTSSDWSVEPPGRSSYVSAEFQAVVEPFSAPETAAGRIARELSLASRTVNCSVYEISDPYVVDQLCRCASRGLKVNILIEGQPVGGLSDRSVDAIFTLKASGAEVKELRSVDSYKRYDYLHAKYMVVDARRVTVMSENWGSGLYANRGWGVTMDGAAVGAYFERVFGSDFNGPLDAMVPKSQGKLLDPVERAGLAEETIRYRCGVMSLLSPDNSGEALKNLIDRASERVLVEQLSVDPEWLEGSSLITSIVEAAGRGVTVRLLLDSSWGEEENQRVADALNAMARTRGMDLEAKVISPYHELSVMHNKGLIIDDLAVISSINWGDSALQENREAGVAVRSKEIASYFGTLFWKDWSVDPVPPVACLSWTHLTITARQPVLLDASNCSDNAPSLAVEWDVDGDGSMDSNATSWAVRLPAGDHIIILTLRDRGNNTVTATCWVSVLPDEGTAPSMTAALLAVPMIVVAMVMGWKRINGSKRH
ncbi:MAG: phospholipase D-like domain-containing protein [Methanomassiliicoccus sp.]|nr:phospholipase D-like domain-containing protein [Methanomassiliicoccus sp.]